MRQFVITALALASLAGPALAQSEGGDYAYQSGPSSRDYGYVGDARTGGRDYEGRSGYGYGGAYGNGGYGGYSSGYAPPSYAPGQGYGGGYGYSGYGGYGGSGYGDQQQGYGGYGYGRPSHAYGGNGYGYPVRHSRRRHRCGCYYYDDDYN